jgi:hypothetical protein
MTGAAARPEPAQPAATAPSRLPPGVTRIRVLRDDNDGLRASSDFADVQAALARRRAAHAPPQRLQHHDHFRRLISSRRPYGFTNWPHLIGELAVVNSYVACMS